jgi:tyrosine-protein kinase Etk/Wzc
VGGGGGAQQRLIEVVLRSRSLTDSMVTRIRARPRHRDVAPGDIRKVMAKGVKVQGDAVLDGSVAVTVTARDPVLAADIANQFPPLVNEIAASLGSQLADRKEKFMEDQLAAAAARLAESEARMVRFEKGSDAVDLQEQGKRTVEAASRLQEAVTEQELRVAAIRRTATPDNPELRAAEGELAARRQALANLTGGRRGNNALYVPLGQSSDLKVAATRVMRDYMRDEQIYKSLTAALTQARMDASDNLPIVGVLDVASPPTAPASRRLGLTLVAATLAGLFMGLVFALAAEYFGRMRGAPGHEPAASADGSAERLRRVRMR